MTKSSGFAISFRSYRTSHLEARRGKHFTSGALRSSSCQDVDSSLQMVFDTSSCRRTEIQHLQNLLVQPGAAFQLDTYVNQNPETLDIVDYMNRTLASIGVLLDTQGPWVNSPENRGLVWKGVVDKLKFKRVGMFLHPDKGTPGAQIMVALTLRNGGAA